MEWRLGLDLGTNSIGWAAIRLGMLEGEETGRSLLAAGTRIFTDNRDKNGNTPAAKRTLARSMRKRRDRYKQRRAALMRHMVAKGLMPGNEADRKALQGLDPFEIRSHALTERVDPHHVGRAIFHLNQRRGFKSNRKLDRKQKDGMVKTGVQRLRAQIEASGAKTFGDFLHKRRRGADPSAVPHVRTRILTLPPEQPGGKPHDVYDFYPDRVLLEEEFQAIWDSQARFSPEVFTEEAGRFLKGLVFDQRPLKPVTVGKCTLLPESRWSDDPNAGDRIPRMHPLFQRRRLLEELNALRIRIPGEAERPLDLIQRNLLLSKLATSRKVKYESLRKALKLPADARFNKESEHRTEMLGDEVAAEMGAKTRFGKSWAILPVDMQWNLVRDLEGLEGDDQVAAFVDRLKHDHGLTPEAADAVLEARFPEGHGRFCELATRLLVERLETEVIVYSEAVANLDLHHSDRRTGEVWVDANGRSALPYYAQVLTQQVIPGKPDAGPDAPEHVLHGRVSNATVHVALNQLRRVVNVLIRRFGMPAQIAVEIGRDLKMTSEEKARHASENSRNRKDAEKRSEKIRELNDIPDTGANRALWKAWEELDRENAANRRCPYSGRQISARMLFNGDAEIDHILPFAETMDDSAGNRVVSLKEANRIKRKRSPYEARHDLQARFGEDASWDAIMERVSKLPKSKAWRFEPDAMRKHAAEGGFLARQLVDTQYLSRLAHLYLSSLYPGSGTGSSKVWVSPGKLTEMLRRNWGLNSLLPDDNYAGGANQPKNRKDHRHHAIDAIVVGLTDRSMINRISREAGLRGDLGANEMTRRLPEPWQDFRAEVRDVVSSIVVSHRPDHGDSAGGRSTAGQLHDEMAYRIPAEGPFDRPIEVFRYAPLTGVKESDLDDIKDDELRSRLVEWTRKRVAEEMGARNFEDANARDRFRGEAFQRALSIFGDREHGFAIEDKVVYPGIRKALRSKKATVIPIRDANGRAYKGLIGNSNHRVEVWELKDGSWKSDIVTMFDAHTKGWVSRIRAENPTARKVLSLKKGDVVAIEKDGENLLLRIVGFNQGARLTMTALNEGGNLQERDRSSNDLDPFKYVYKAAHLLKEWKGRQVRIDETGRVLDPGFPARKTK